MPQIASLLEEALGIPKFHHDIARWNEAWEAKFPRLDCSLDALIVSGRVSGFFKPTGEGREVWFNNIRNQMRRASTLQDELRVVAVTSAFQPTFCWKKLTPSAREAHILEGLLRTCLSDKETIPLLRLFTSDITLVSLQSEDGEGFLTLLRQYVPANDGVVANRTLTSYLHPCWTQEKMKPLQEAGLEPDVQACTVLRDAFLSASVFDIVAQEIDGCHFFAASFLYHTLLSVFGVPRPPEISVKEPNGVYTTRVDWTAFSNKRLSNSSKVKNGAQASAPVYRLAQLCDRCREVERDGTRFSVCKVCNDRLSRKVYYCSRECQAADWPNHKQVCGKNLTSSGVADEKFVQTESGLADDIFMLRKIGPAQAQYQRSFALVRQIQFIDMLPSCDYVFFSDSGPDRFEHSKFITRLILRLARQIAMTTGDPECIAAVCELVLAGDPDIFLPLTEQLSAEYGVDAGAVFKAAELRREQHPHHLSAILVWANEFLNSEYGSRHADLWELSKAPSLELTRKVIQDLRAWWKSRQMVRALSRSFSERGKE
ncbi:hypothetical protein B0H19DRAFT_93225 [Mycena capillaripes]|nr:hypothetical protein B0H19DRAFT_93225 [Mycena capillaripes]